MDSNYLLWIMFILSITVWGVHEEYGHLLPAKAYIPAVVVGGLPQMCMFVSLLSYVHNGAWSLHMGTMFVVSSCAFIWLIVNFDSGQRGPPLT